MTGYPLTFYLVQPAAQGFLLSSEISQQLQDGVAQNFYRHSRSLDNEL